MAETPIDDQSRVVPSAERLVTGPFVAVTISALAFFIYIGMLVVAIPRFVENELGAGELGVGLTLAVFAGAAISVRPLIGWAGDRFGRRRLMFVGALVAAGAGATAGLTTTLPALLLVRALTGMGEAAVFVGAATIIADLAPAHRRAEAASYFSVAVFGGIGIGPILGERLIGVDRYALTFLIAGLVAFVAALTVLAIPRSVDRRAATGAAVRRRFLHPVALWPGVVLACGIGGFGVFGAFLPEHARSVGLSGAGGLFFVYSLVCLVLRIVAARVPERLGAGRSVTVALVLIGTALTIVASVHRPGALWAAAVIVGAGMAFLYPSLMALVVDRAPEAERTSAISSFTMFFEIGNIIGGLSLGMVAQLFSKSAGFAGGAVMAVIGLIALWTRAVDRPIGPPRSTVVAATQTEGIAFTPVAGE